MPVIHPSCFCLHPSQRHAPKDLNPDQLGWNQPCCQLHQGRVLCLRAAEAVGLEPTTAKPRPVFKTGSSSGRMTSVHSIKLRGLESNQRPPGSEPGVTTSSNYPGILLGHRWCGKARGEGVEPPSPGSKPGSVPLAHPRSCRVPCGNRTRLSSLEGWCLSRSAKGTCRQGGRRGSRTLKAILKRLVPVRAGCHRPLACPSIASRLRRQESNLRQGD
jgi:hypothetical protein